VSANIERPDDRPEPAPPRMKRSVLALVVLGTVAACGLIGWLKVKELQRGPRLSPEAERIVDQMSRAMGESREWSIAIICVRELHDLSRDLSGSTPTTAQQKRLREAEETAASAVDDVLRAHPDEHPDMYEFRAGLPGKSYDEAIELLDKGIAINQKGYHYGEAYAMRAHRKLLAGRPGAKEDLEKALSLDQTAYCRYVEALFAEDEGDLDEAVRVMKISVAMYEKFPPGILGPECFSPHAALARISKKAETEQAKPK
jgi:tetratricopeptide (TPR) repeat protein